jgi:c-di-GMP-binding flagellar brake protein YcgR
MAETKKNQKRRYVRLEVVLPVKYRKYTGNPVLKGEFNVGKTYDLSVGGTKMTVSRAIPVGTKLDMEIELDDDLRPYLVGKVLSGEDKVIDGISRRVEKVSFVEVDADAQDMMMKYIFDHQRHDVRKDKKRLGGK